MIEDFKDTHRQSFLQLNQEFVHWLSPLDEQALNYILDRATYKRCICDPQSGALLGALIAYGHDVDYPDHWNLTWLREHLDGFLYIDRIVISAAAQGQGVGRQLYQDLTEYAVQHGYQILACEVNTRPDNPASHAFHRKLGFEALGQQEFPERAKAVRYYAKGLEKP